MSERLSLRGTGKAAMIVMVANRTREIRPSGMTWGACGNVGRLGAGLRPIGKPMESPPDPSRLRAPHFYPDQCQERQQVPRLGLRRGGQLRPSLLPGSEAILRAQEAQDEHHCGDQGAGAQTGARLLPHAARAEALRREPMLRVTEWPKTASQESGLVHNPSD